MPTQEQLHEIHAEMDAIRRYIGMEDGGAAPPAPQEMPRQAKAKRAISRITGVCFYAVLLAAIAAAFFIGGGGGAPRSLMGYSVMMVLTDSMHSEIPRGSIVAIKRVDPAELQVGDDITYIREDNSTVTHRVIGITENYAGSGLRGFQTQGVDNRSPDPDIVYANNIAGKVEWHGAFIGQAAAFLRANWIFTVILAGIVLALTVTLRIFFSADKKPRKEAPQ